MTDIKKLEAAMQTLRQERTAYVQNVLGERQAENDRIAKTAGTTPTTAQLTISDFQTIEERFNRPLADLKERHRQAEAANAAASVEPIEDEIDAAQAEADKARQVLEAKEALVKAAQGRLKIAQGIITRSKEKDRRIVFESLVADLMSDRYSHSIKKDIPGRILNY